MPAISGAVGSTKPPRQLKQSSRKGKKAWRKNVDVTDVERAQEEAVEEQILFGSRLTDKESDEFFVLNTKPDEALDKRTISSKNKERRLRADEIIAQRSAVAAVSSRKRPAAEPAKGTVTSKKHKKDWVSHKDLAHLRDVADGKKESTSLSVEDATYDVWGDEYAYALENSTAASSKIPPCKGTVPKSRDGVPLTFLPEEKPINVPTTIRHQSLSLAANGRPIPAVPKPSGGYSYNPQFEDYQARYMEESNKAVEAERRRLREEAEDEARQLAALRSAAEAEAAESRADLSEWEDDETEWEGIESEGEGLKTTIKRPGRKTPTQRNRVKRRKEDEGMQKHEAAMKKRDAQARRIREIAREVEKEEKARNNASSEADVKDENDDEEGNDSTLRRKSFGKVRIPEKDLELVLPDELQDSLRLLKPEGNSLRDRYRSLLVRGKVEPRSYIHAHKKARTRLTEKWTHKDFRLL